MKLRIKTIYTKDEFIYDALHQIMHQQEVIVNNGVNIKKLDKLIKKMPEISLYNDKNSIILRKNTPIRIIIHLKEE